AIGAKRNGIHSSLMALKYFEALTNIHSPETYYLIVTDAGKKRIIRAESYRPHPVTMAAKRSQRSTIGCEPEANFTIGCTRREQLPIGAIPYRKNATEGVTEDRGGQILMREVHFGKLDITKKRLGDCDMEKLHVAIVVA